MGIQQFPVYTARNRHYFKPHLYILGSTSSIHLIVYNFYLIAKEQTQFKLLYMLYIL